MYTLPHIHTLLKASPVFISQCKQTKNNYTAHIGFHITPTSGQGGLDIFETRPLWVPHLSGMRTQASLGLHFKFRGLGLSLWESLCDLDVTRGRFWHVHTQTSRPICRSVLQQVYSQMKCRSIGSPRWARRDRLISTIFGGCCSLVV